MAEHEDSKSEEPNADAVGGSFSESLAEIEEIVGRIEAEDVDIDLLADELRRAAELLEVCRSKIRRAEVEVRNVVESLDEGEESD